MPDQRFFAPDTTTHPGLPQELGAGPNSEGERESAIALRRQIFDLHAVFEIARQFNEVWDTDALLDGILLVAIEHVRVGAAAIVVSGLDDSPQLTRRKSKGWDVSKEPDWSVQLESDLAQCLAEYRRPMPIEVVAARCVHSRVILEQMRSAGCVLIAPMVRHDRLRGVLYFAERLDRAPYTAGDLAFIDVLSDQFTVSLDNAYLYEKEQRTNDQLTQTRNRLASTEKLAALGQMAATIAHEVRNPLGIIRNYLTLIRPELDTMSVQQAYVDVISEELIRIEDFVKSLLGAFHPERQSPGAVKWRNLIDDVAHFLSPRLSQLGITIINRVSDEIPDVQAEPEALRQVLVNVFLNAMDAMPGGGTIALAASADRERVHLTITDSGDGVPSELLDRLFESYVTSKPEGEGSGLGLSICRTLLERFEAQIAATNVPAPGHGAIFTVYLRRYVANPVTAANESTPGTGTVR